MKHVQSELDKPTIALLRSAKRFVATIALENNTGLVDAMAHTTDVANFLRGYPAQTLTLASVFVHLPKVRQSRYYDLNRLARLVEATTLTLRERMVGTLRGRQYQGGGRKDIVLGLTYAQYEKLVRRPTQDVFVLFDARYAEFSEFFLDQGRIR